MIANKPIPSPTKWHGGKGAFNGKLAKWIISLMPPHLHYVEPYFGGGSVLFAKDPEGVSEAVNDLNVELINFWLVIRDPDLFRQFQRQIEATPFSEDHYGAAKEVLALHARHRLDDTEERQVRWAVAFFTVCRQSLAGRMNGFAPLSRNRTRRNMNEQASAWLSAVEGLPEVHARLKRVVILGPKPALEVIRQQDGPNTCFYLDPPYSHDTRKTTGEYMYEMTYKDHVELLETLNEIKGKFLLSGYNNGMYDEWAFQSNFQRHDFNIPNNAASGKSKRQMTESVWTNF